MKPPITVFTLFLCLIFTGLTAQTYKQCAHCKMDVKNIKFQAKAAKNGGKTYHFDAIECLVNYLKTKEEGDFNQLWVTDYNTEKYIEAASAYFLKSKSLPSPMGANLSAYSSEKDAKAGQKTDEDEVMDWGTLKKQFVSSNFGAVDHSHHHHGPGSYAPSGIMGDHLHAKGGFMVSLRYMKMAMSGNREGSNEISDEEIYQRFMVAPQEMTMQMYMLGVMYGVSDKLTLMLMQNFVKKDMDLTARMMMNNMPMLRDFSTSSDGLGDLKLGLLYSIMSTEKLSFHLNTKFNIPIGDIENRDATPMMANAKLPYTMQLGSGTFDITFGGTLKGNHGDFSWGIQQLNTFRTGTNNEGYRFGNLYELNSWAGYALSNNVGATIRLTGSKENEIKGMDSELNPMMVTTADTNNYGGERIWGGAGFNIGLAKNKLVLGAEISFPLYQNFNGIFMDSDHTLNTCAKYTIF
ncbi:nitrous oxide reductase accessory protein NosL [Flagellimonas sp. S3867]|uniref:nitrous oxide reductase accessory protein NosL n=1 Tax=Flagellimonas sp. S3867 TaxID=2768063 RepID=UPI0016857558|nr:nitrous oxide reductase accessory protein NosL [Flagellimonas sp. S3867]